MPIFAQYFAQLLQKIHHSLVILRSYWTDVHRIFTRCRGISAVAILQCIVERQSKEQITLNFDV